MTNAQFPQSSQPPQATPSDQAAPQPALRAAVMTPDVTQAASIPAAKVPTRVPALGGKAAVPAPRGSQASAHPARVRKAACKLRRCLEVEEYPGQLSGELAAELVEPLLDRLEGLPEVEPESLHPTLARVLAVAGGSRALAFQLLKDLLHRLETELIRPWTVPEVRLAALSQLRRHFDDLELGLFSVQPELGADPRNLRRRIEHDKLMRSLYNAAPSAVMLLGPSGEIWSANRQACAIFGRDLRELMGHALGELMDPSSLDQVRTALEIIKEERVWQERVLARHADGASLPVDISLTRVDMELGRAYHVVLRDASREEELARQLADEQAQLHEMATALRTMQRTMRGESPQPLQYGEACCGGDLAEWQGGACALEPIHSSVSRATRRFAQGLRRKKAKRLKATAN